MPKGQAKVYKGSTVGGPVNREKLTATTEIVDTVVTTELAIHGSTKHLLVTVTNGHYEWQKTGEYFLWHYETSNSFVKGAE
jgi:hypothetical protein